MIYQECFQTTKLQNMKLFYFLIFTIPFLGFSQGFSPPRNNVNVSNKVFSQLNQLMQHQHLIKTLQNKFENTEFIKFEGGHLFPLEQPQNTSSLIKFLILEK